MKEELYMYKVRGEEGEEENKQINSRSYRSSISTPVTRDTISARGATSSCPARRAPVTGGTLQSFINRLTVT